MMTKSFISKASKGFLRTIIGLAGEFFKLPQSVMSSELLFENSNQSFVRQNMSKLGATTSIMMRFIINKYSHLKPKKYYCTDFDSVYSG